MSTLYMNWCNTSVECRCQSSYDITLYKAYLFYKCSTAHVYGSEALVQKRYTDGNNEGSTHIYQQYSNSAQLACCQLSGWEGWGVLS